MSSLEERYRVQQLLERQKNGVKRKLRWNNASRIRRSLAAVNNMVLSGTISHKEANSIYYSCNLLLKAIEIETAEKKNRI